MITNIVDFLGKKGFAIEQTEAFMNRMLEDSFFTLSTVDYIIEDETQSGEKIQVLNCTIDRVSGESFVYTVRCILTDVWPKDDALGHYLRDKKREFFFQSQDVLWPINCQDDFFLWMAHAIIDYVEALEL